MATRASKQEIYIGDFETTVYDGQAYTEVWASALVKLGTEDVIILHSIEETFNYISALDMDMLIYYHNLKFDGSFWLDYLLVQKGFKQASYIPGGDSDITKVKWYKGTRKMPADSVAYSISNMGQWYRIIWKHHGRIIELRDSLKLIPLSVKEMGKAFKTEHQKLEMEYKGYRYAGCEITPEERKYIANDVLVVKEALEVMFSEGHTGMTIGSCCLGEYKNILGSKQYKTLFPNVYNMYIDEKKYGARTVGDYIHKAYKGGWCYVVPKKAHKIKKHGLTADVNSLYPSVMHSDSGSVYPFGEPYLWKGDYIPEEAQAKNRYYYIRIRTRFYLKPGKLPFIQIKGSFVYRATECLTTSDVWIEERKRYETYYADPDGNVCDTRVTLTMTMTDYVLFREHYEVVDFEILDGCFFNAMCGMFDEYINKYRALKMQAKGGRRTIAKLFLNNLYGKFAASDDSSFKYGIIDADNLLKFIYIEEYEKVPGYLPVGAAVTSYARNFTIRAAQKNYYGENKRGFIYADTDSIHCDLKPEELIGIPVHPTAFNHWKIECEWDEAYFARQKTYIEHCVREDGEEVEPHYIVKAAGMPQRCKELFMLSLEGKVINEEEGYSPAEVKFVNEKRRKLKDFDVGLSVPGKLMPKRIRGGIILVDETFEMHPILPKKVKGAETPDTVEKR